MRHKNGDMEASEEDLEDPAEVKAGQKKKGQKAKVKAKKKTAQKKKNQNKDPKATKSLYKPGEYGDARKRYIAEMRDSHACSYREASDWWNTSDERAALLQHMPRKELLRRRFISKDD